MHKAKWRTISPKRSATLPSAEPLCVMRSILYILLVVLIIAVGCKNDELPPENESGYKSVINTTETDSVIKLPSAEPSQILVGFIQEIENQDWISDTTRVKKIGLYGLQDVNIQLFHGYPFYDLKYDQTTVYDAFQYDPTNDQKEAGKALSQASQIWGYYYQDKNGDNFISDGMIEQWVYADTLKSGLAFKYLEKHVNNIYFNTMPFIYQMDESIFIFHARAMAFSYDQKPLFKLFVEKMDSSSSKN